MATILIVDDRPVNRELLVTLLTYTGHRPLEAADGEEGLEIARAEHPDLIITDIIMPRMDGYEFARQVRADSVINNTQIIFYTSSYIVAETRSLAAACGVSIVIGKTIAPAEFLEQVRLALATKQASVPPPDDFHREHMRMLTDALAKKVDELEAEIVERKQAEDSLRASELRFRMTLENLMEGCQIIGYDWRYHYLNDAAVKFSELTREEMLGHTVMECYPGIEDSALFTALRRCMEERTSHHTVNEFIAHDGSKGWFEFSIQPAPDGIFILSSDITQNKLAEAALLEREMKLTTLFEILPVGISILDAERNVSYTNPTLNKILGMSEAGVRDGAYGNRKYLKGDGTLMPADELATVRVLKEKRAIDNVETGVVKEDNSIIWLDVSAVPVDFPDWKIVVVTSDITERKQVAQALEESEVKFSVAFRSSPLALAITTLDGKFVETNHAFCELIGYSNEEIIGNTAVELELLGEQDRERLLAILKDHRGLVSNFEVQFHIRNGSLRDILYSLTNISFRGESHRLSTGVDITERKQVEREIQKLNSELEGKVAERTATLAQANTLLQTMMDHVPDHIYFKDLKSRFIRNNKAQLKMLGVSDSAQVIGKTDFDFFPHAQQSFTEEQEIIRSGQPIIGLEEKVTWPDGHETWFSTTKMPLRDQAEQIIGTFGIGRDITDRKQAEAALQQANQQLEQLSLIDELTGLYNRRGFLLHAAQQLLLARRLKYNLLVFYADLDGLKQINDKLGHIAGDEAIVTMARALQETFRASDIKARLGGDEFIVLAMKVDEYDVQTLLMRLRKRLATNNLSLSIGSLSIDPQSEESIHAIIGRADEAMYVEKRHKPSHRKT